MERVCERLRMRMHERGHGEELVERVLQSMRSFALYGFPESHAISFALIAYSSAWMKVHRAVEFYVSLLNNQPMGFYSSATLIQDARAHGIRVLPASVLHSHWRCNVEDDRTVRLGLCMIGALCESHALKLLEARKQAPFVSLPDFQRRCGLHREELRAVARSGALQGLAAHRREALWRVQEPVEDDLFSLAAARFSQTSTEKAFESSCPLAPMDAAERLSADFATTGVTVGAHPMRFLRAQIPHAWTAASLRSAPDGASLCTAGMVICRQRPGTAKGFVFLSLEDETGISNIVVPPRLYENIRLLIAEESFLQIDGVVQQREGVTHVKARRIRAMRTAVPSAPSHDFH
jgi:error-prone DNA polymerase